MKLLGTKLFYYFFTTLIVQILADSSSIDCNFERGLCGWSFHNGWFVTNNSSNVDPGHDHTCLLPIDPLPCGKWLSTVSKFNGEQDFIVKGPRMNPTTKTSCFSFWYHFFGLERSEFKVMINSKSNEFDAQDMWVKRTPQGNNWAQGYVSIPAQSTQFYIIIKATLSAKYQDRVGLDDITFRLTACPQTTDCDLESGLCGWTNQGFQLTNSSDIVDHTTGTNWGKILLNQGPAHMAQTSISFLNLTSPFTNNVYSFCFEFWYYFSLDENSPQNTGSFLQFNNSDSTAGNVRWTLEDIYQDGQENSWNPLYMTIPVYNRNQNPTITISSFTNGNTQIAIDDLLIQSGSCQQYGACDFESDMCGWKNNGFQYSSNALWLRNTGGGTRTGVKNSPQIDTTTSTANGWFAMVPTEQLNKATHQALLQSPLLYRSTSCFSFNYYAIGNDDKTPILRVYFIDLVSRKIFQRAMINTTTTNSATSHMGWNKFNYSLPDHLPNKYYVTITTIRTHTPLESDIAIDDISFQSTKCDGSSDITTTTTKIPNIEYRWNCDFESRCSSWMFDSNWKITSYKEAQNKLSSPKNDHTNKNSRGHYLLWSPTSQLPHENGTIIISKINSTSLTDQRHCLSFWYYDLSEIKFQLSVQTISNIQIHEKTITSNYISQSWKLARANIRSMKEGGKIQLQFSPSGNINGSFAIDDITLTPGRCNHYDYTYTFDLLEDIELSRISPIHHYMGQISHKNTTQYPDAPGKDFTTGTGGYFLFMNKKNDFNTTYQDLLTIGNIPSLKNAQHPNCVRFAYQLSGNTWLNAYILESDNNGLYYPKLILSHNHKSWVVAEFSYNDAHYEHKLVLQMVKEYDLTSYIALDDLSINNKHCNQDLGCDFDDDICSFYFSYSEMNDYEFARYIGPPQTSSWIGPPFDHTRRTYGGGYLYMTGYPSTVEELRDSIMQTPIRTTTDFFHDDNLCFSVWTMITQPDASLTIELNLYSPKNPKLKPTQPIILIMALTNLTESKWSRHFAEIDLSGLKRYSEFSVTITGKTKKATSFIAIDDIEIEHDSCDKTNLFVCNNHKQIDYSLVCNFHDDCSDGSDEKNCGDSNFEKDNCGWISNDDPDKDHNQNKFGATGRWQRFNAHSGNGPNVDGSGNVNGEYLVMVSGNKNVASTIGTLDHGYGDYRTQFKLSYFTCTMTFDYYLEMTEGHCPMLAVLVGNTEASEVIRVRYDEPSKQWQKGIVYIGGHTGSFTVKFLATLFNLNSTLAIDNIEFNNCSIPNSIGPKSACPEHKFLCKTTRVCIEPDDRCDFEDDCGDNWDEGFDVCSEHIFNPKAVPSCDFENSIESCGFSKDKANVPITTTATSNQWMLDNGNTYLFSIYNGPFADHTVKDSEGGLVSFYASKITENGKLSAELYSPMMTTTISNSSNKDCSMRFFYYNNGLDSELRSELNVRVQFADSSIDDSDTLFVTNSYLPNWIKGKAKYQSSLPFQFVFKGTVSSIESSISIDDVSFSDGCIISNVAPFNSTKKYPGRTVVIVIGVLVVLIVAVVGYFLYRRIGNGRQLLATFSKNPLDRTTLANANHNN